MELIVAYSSFYIHALRSKRQPFREMERLVDRVEWATTGMIMLEVCRSLLDSDMRDRFAERYSTMIYLLTTNDIWERASRLAWTLDRQGRILPAQDTVIAAACLGGGPACSHTTRILGRFPISKYSTPWRTCLNSGRVTSLSILKQKRG